MDSIWMQLLTFALPGGFLGSVFTWIFSRRKQNNDFLKELQSSINLLSGENKKILEENIQLRRENIDLKANQEEMLVRIDRLTKEVERLRRTIGKRTSHEDNTLFGTAHRTAGELCTDDGSGRHSDRKRPARASLRARRRGRTMPATMILFSEENPPQAIPAVETSRPTVPVMALAVNLRNSLPEASRLIHKSIWMRIRSPTGKGV